MSKVLYTGFEGPWSHSNVTDIGVNGVGSVYYLNNRYFGAIWKETSVLANSPFVYCSWSNGLWYPLGQSFYITPVVTHQTPHTRNINGGGALLQSGNNGTGPGLMFYNYEKSTGNTAIDKRFSKGWGCCYRTRVSRNDATYLNKMRLHTFTLNGSSYSVEIDNNGQTIRLAGYRGTDNIQGSYQRQDATGDPYRHILSQKNMFFDYTLVAGLEYLIQHELTPQGKWTCYFGGTKITYQFPSSFVSQMSGMKYVGFAGFPSIYAYWPTYKLYRMDGMDDFALNDNLSAFPHDPNRGIPKPIRGYAMLSAYPDGTNTWSPAVLSATATGGVSSVIFVTTSGAGDPANTGVLAASSVNNYDKRTVAIGLANNDTLTLRMPTSSVAFPSNYQQYYTAGSIIKAINIFSSGVKTNNPDLNAFTYNVIHDTMGSEYKKVSEFPSYDMITGATFMYINSSEPTLDHLNQLSISMVLTTSE